MPYIKEEARKELALYRVLPRKIANAGELNYMLTVIVKDYLKHNGESYQYFNDCIGALEGAKLELYRRRVAPYEDDKIIRNGDVYSDRNAVVHREAATGAEAA
jgi:hypothetical protein